jgi:2-oxoglutarate/2-oxoacid ferredoxin oxidoreductase subunit alpha
MSRISCKIVGSQGQGVNAVGEFCSKGLKRKGYAVFAYREYMSLIKGGHSSYQLDVSNKLLASTEEVVDVLVCLNHHGLENNLHDLKPNGLLIHMTPDWAFSKADTKFIKRNSIQVCYLPVLQILQSLKARPILANSVLSAVLWASLGQDKRSLKKLIAEQFAHKGPKVIAKNYECIEAGFAHAHEHAIVIHAALPRAKSAFKNNLLITGSEAMGLGTIHAGCRVYIGYPMTPSSPMLSYIAGLQNKTHMVIKQAEDEITAAQMMSGAMFMGTRAMTGTSGGGYDLMTETISLNGMIENPSVIMLAQRPGPATGLPTWTGQGDLLLAVHSAHGEFPRCVISVSDSEDAFYLMAEAFNIAEQFQCPVTILTDKQIAEALYTQKPYDQKRISINRGLLVTSQGALNKLQGTDRYDHTATDGISPRWLPGSKADTYCAQGDEHNGDGSVDETAENAVQQMEKRMEKLAALKEALPEPILYGSSKPEVLLVGWGSSKGPILDAIEELKKNYVDVPHTIGYLHFEYLWPLKTDLFAKLHASAKRTVCIEGNYQGQLAMLLQQEVGVQINERILKYDGRPFFLHELTHQLSQYM